MLCERTDALVLAAISAGADPREVDIDEARDRLDRFLISPLSNVDGQPREVWEWRVAMGLAKPREV